MADHIEVTARLKRTTDASFLNSVINQPCVRQWVGPGEANVDLTALLADPANFALVNEFGGFIFARIGPERYEVHSQFLPGALHIIEAAREAVTWMFTATDCTEIVTRVPENNRPALGLARAAGFQHSFRREAAWPAPGEETLTLAVDYLTLSMDKWVGADAETAFCLLAHAGNIAKGAWAFNRHAARISAPPIHIVSDIPPVVKIGETLMCVNEGQLEVL